MCPICWATLLATFSLTIAASAALIAGRDRIVLSLAVPLVGLAIVHRSGIATLPWGVFAVMTAAVVARLVWVVAGIRGHALVGAAWTRALEIAADSCPRRRPLAVRNPAACMAERSDRDGRLPHAGGPVHG